MIGDKYWSTGISLKWDGHDKWSATADFFDDGFCDHESTEGVLRTRYFVDLTLAIDTLIADAERLGIIFRDLYSGAAGPCLYYLNDGDSEDWPPPDGWREILSQQAERIKWRTYQLAEVPA